MLSCLVCLTLSSCSVFQLSEYDGFGDLYLGSAGFVGAADAAESPIVPDERAPWFGHFRTPEILVQPAGGLQFPGYRALEGGGWSLTGLDGRELVFTYYEPHRVRTYRGEIPSPVPYSAFDAGLVEVLIPYKAITSSESVRHKLGAIVRAPFWFAFGFCFRIPVYVAHDVMKTSMIPIAAWFYAIEFEGLR